VSTNQHYHRLAATNARCCRVWVYGSLVDWWKGNDAPLLPPLAVVDKMTGDWGPQPPPPPLPHTFRMDVRSKLKVDGKRPMAVNRVSTHVCHGLCGCKPQALPDGRMLIIRTCIVALSIVLFLYPFSNGIISIFTRSFTFLLHVVFFLHTRAPP
jgi:hypothetical protein